MYKLGFIGCGNMATAIIGGAVSSDYLKGEEICVFDVDNSKAEFLNKEYGVNISSTVEDIAEKCEFIVLAVKPQVFPVVLPQIKEYVKEQKAQLKDRLTGQTATLLIVQVGDIDASNRYVKHKINDCKEVGITPIHLKFHNFLTFCDYMYVLLKFVFEDSLM